MRPGAFAALGLVVLGAAGPARAQPEVALANIAERARSAFLAHDFGAVLDHATNVRLRLPGQAVGAGVRGEVAAAALAAFARRHEELEIRVVGAAVVEQGHGYVELRRRFRLAGVAQEQLQRILFSARLVGGDWRIAEIWIVETGPNRSGVGSPDRAQFDPELVAPAHDGAAAFGHIKLPFWPVPGLPPTAAVHHPRSCIKSNRELALQAPLETACSGEDL